MNHAPTQAQNFRRVFVCRTIALSSAAVHCGGINIAKTPKRYQPGPVIVGGRGGTTPLMLAAQHANVPTTDEQLLARFRSGDTEAFGLVYNQYERQVFRYAYHLIGQRDDADDIKQETFLRAYQALPNFRHDCGLLAWLLKICGNLCRDRLRSWDRRNVVYDSSRDQDAILDERPHANPHTLVERAQTNDTIRRALGGLPPAQREIVVLHEIEGLDYETIAQILNCTRAGVKLRVFRARRSLKERVNALLNDNNG